jgi:hypothetical protein
MKIDATSPFLLSLIDEQNHQRFCYVSDPERAPKPFIHPIRLSTGEVITQEAPADHTWHRGIWLAWKFVNGVNYWEERDAVIGKQRNITPPEMLKISPEKFLLTHQISWHDDDENPEATKRLTESRKIALTYHDNQTLQVDWESRFIPTNDTLLDRTPFTTWGGYGGLVTRLSAEATDTQIVFSDGTRTHRPTGEHYLWGGIEGTVGDADFAIVFLPHPSNRRFPEPFYGNANEKSNFFGSAPLFHEPLLLQKDEEFLHQVRVVILQSRITDDRIMPYLWEKTELHG